MIAAISTCNLVAKGSGELVLRYYFQGDDVSLLSNLEEVLPDKIAYMEEILGQRLTGTIHVKVTLTEEEFTTATRGRIPRWAGGVAYPDKSAIVVKTPLFFGQGVPLEVLTAHELAHIFIHRATDGNYVPRWLNEGICMLLAGESRSGTLVRLSNAAVSDRLMGLPRVDYVLGFSRPDAELAYAEARSATQLFVDQFGWDGVRRLLHEVERGTHFEEAFESTTGVEYEFWQVEWLDFARDRYRGSAIFLQFDELVWIFIVFLAILAMITVYIRQKLQLKRWTEEEDNQNEDYDDYDDSNDPDDYNEYGDPIHPR